MNYRTLFWGVLGLSSLACVDVTTRTNRDHCTFNEGDRYCAEMFDSLPFCTQGQNECSSGERYGCVAEITPECHRPCGNLPDDECMDMGSSGTDTGTSSESSTGSSSGSESSTTGPEPCEGNEDCPDAAAPLCEPSSGECVGCDAFGAEGDAACAGLDPAMPLCVGGACVACTPENPVVCDDQLLLCDGDTNSCTACTEHAQCGSGACELDVGRCFPDDFVVHVDGDPTAMPMPDYTSITAAVAAVDDGTHGVIVVHELDMAASYQAAVTIDGGKTIALLAAPGEAPRIQGTAGSPGLRVEGAGTILYTDGLSLRNGDVQGLLVDSAFAWVDRSRIVQNSGGGVLAQGGAELVLRNCFVGSLGDVIGVEVVDASASVLYSTITASTFGMTPALGCSTPVAVDVRNSIIVSQGGTSPDELSCVAATVVASATEADVGAFNAGWFVDFNGGNYHLTALGTSAFADVASWTAGDPTTDIDGDPRPTVDGTADYAGADVP